MPDLDGNLGFDAPHQLTTVTLALLKHKHSFPHLGRGLRVSLTCVTQLEDTASPLAAVCRRDILLVALRLAFRGIIVLSPRPFEKWVFSPLFTTVVELDLKVFMPHVNRNFTFQDGRRAALYSNADTNVSPPTRTPTVTSLQFQ